MIADALQKGKNVACDDLLQKIHLVCKGQHGMVFLEVVISKGNVVGQMIKFRGHFHLREIWRQRTILNMKLHLLLSYQPA